MKRSFMVLVMFTLVGFTVACGNANQDENNEIVIEEYADNENDEQANIEANEGNASERDEGADDQQYMQDKMAELDFYEIEVEVSYGKDKEYEAEIEKDENRPIKAEIEDEINDEYFKGREAFDLIYANAKKLSLSSDSAQQEVIDQVMDAFALPQNYTKVEIEIKFHDGSEIDFEVQP